MPGAGGPGRGAPGQSAEDLEKERKRRQEEQKRKQEAGPQRTGRKKKKGVDASNKLPTGKQTTNQIYSNPFFSLTQLEVPLTPLTIGESEGLYLT